MKKATIILIFTYLLAGANSFAQQQVPKAYSKNEQQISAFLSAAVKTGIDHTLINASDFPTEGTGFYRHKGWLAINPNNEKTASSQIEFKFQQGKYDLLFSGVGESDGESAYVLFVNGKQVMNFQAPLSKFSYEEGVDYSYLIENIQLKPGDLLKIAATVGTDGAEYSRARWGGIILVEAGKGKQLLKKLKNKGTTETLIK
jgi:hypothetical protein